MSVKSGVRYPLERAYVSVVLQLAFLKQRNALSQLLPVTKVRGPTASSRRGLTTVNRRTERHAGHSFRKKSIIRSRCRDDPGCAASGARRRKLMLGDHLDSPSTWTQPRSTYFPHRCHRESSPVRDRCRNRPTAFPL